jgi:acyl-CoA dehydrogenase
MSTMEKILIEPFSRMLAEVASPEKVRAAQKSGDIAAIWNEIQASGCLDALLSEDAGGAGLTLADVFPLVAETGAYCLPAPFAETMIARALLSSHSASVPQDAIIVIAAPSPVLPLSTVATHALMQRQDALALVKLESDGQDPFGALGGIGTGKSRSILTVEAGGTDLMLAAAALTAAKMAGAMRRLLDMSLAYARERNQFGRPLGKFQAIQQQLAVMAQQVVSAKVAANVGMSGAHFDPLKVALAKCRTSEASHVVCDIAHAVHGAIGVTEEYDLQLLTRRLKQWQMAYGSESYWAGRIGAARVAQVLGTSADFVRHNLQAE